MADVPLIALTIRRFFRIVPLVSNHRHEDIAVALADLNLKFDDQDAVLPAYRKTTHMGWFYSLCDVVFHLGDKTTNRISRIGMRRQESLVLSNVSYGCHHSER
jgi:hypothetical protein